MATTRRELLGAGAASLGLLSLDGLRGAAAQNMQAAAGPSESWDSGELAHVLPTSSHDRILIKTSFKRPLEAPPTLQVGDQRVTGERTDSRGSFWQFHVADLKPGTTYTLSLASFDGRSLCQPWTLSTMPALDQLPSELRLLVYSCAGGHDIFLSAKTGVRFFADRGPAKAAATSALLLTRRAHCQRGPRLLGSPCAEGRTQTGRVQGRHGICPL